MTALVINGGIVVERYSYTPYGTATVYEGDDPSCSGVMYSAGSAFVDAGGTHVHLVRNESATEELVTVAFQIIPQGAARRIDAPKPSQCP